MISFPQSEVLLSKFLHLWRCFSRSELCLHQKLDVRLPCPDIFKGKSITFLFQWIKLIKKPAVYSGAFERKLFFGGEWKQRQRWKESFLKRNKKAYTKECINVESGGNKMCIICGLRVEKREGPMDQSFSFSNIKVLGEESLLKVPWTNLTVWSLKYSHNVSILLGLQKNSCGQTLQVRQTECDVSISRQQTHQE